LAPTTTCILTLSLHDALPISIPLNCSEERRSQRPGVARLLVAPTVDEEHRCAAHSALETALNVLQHSRAVHVPLELALHARCIQDRKSTRLNSSHVSISYAVF